MRSNRLSALGLTAAALALHAVPLAAQAITPRFDWKPGAVARITTKQSYRAASAAGSDSTAEELGLHHVDHLATGPDPRGLALVWSGAHTFHREDRLLAQDLDPAADPMRRAGGVVDARGRLVAFRDTVKLRLFADSSRDATLAKLGDLSPQAKATFGYGYSPAAMGARATKGWYEETGQWVERSWSPRDSLVDSLSLPTAPGATTRSRVFLRVRRYDGDVPCPAGHPGRCWSFTETVTIGGPGIVPAIQSQARALGFGEMVTGMAELADMQATTTIVRIVDADDFRPLLRRQTQVTSGADGKPGGRLESLRTYRWQ